METNRIASGANPSTLQTLLTIKEPPSYTDLVTGMLNSHKIGGMGAKEIAQLVSLLQSKKKYPSWPNIADMLESNFHYNGPLWKDAFALDLIGTLNDHGIKGMGDKEFKELITIIQSKNVYPSWPNIADILESKFNYNGPLWKDQLALDIIGQLNEHGVLGMSDQNIKGLITTLQSSGKEVAWPNIADILERDFNYDGPLWKDQYYHDVINLMNSHGILGMSDQNIKDLIITLQSNDNELNWKNIAAILIANFHYDSGIAAMADYSPRAGYRKSSYKFQEIRQFNPQRDFTVSAEFEWAKYMR